MYLGDLLNRRQTFARLLLANVWCAEVSFLTTPIYIFTEKWQMVIDSRGKYLIKENM